MKTNWKLTETLDAIKCPNCEGYNRLSLSVDKRSIYCAVCGNGITPEYLKTQGFVLTINSEDCHLLTGGA